MNKYCNYSFFRKENHSARPAQCQPLCFPRFTPDLALVANPANNPRYLPFHQVVLRGIGGLNALLNGTRLVPIAAAIRQQLELAAAAAAVVVTNVN